MAKNRPPRIDPTENVKALVVVSNQRQDDLRAAMKAEIDQHFALKREHIEMLERRIDDQLKHIAQIVKDHSDQDLRGFDAVRHELALHLAEDIRVHNQIQELGMERMLAVKDLLQKSIESLDRASRELAVNMDKRFDAVVEWRQALADVLRQVQRDSISTETFSEFRKTTQTSIDQFQTFMQTNAGEKQGIKNLWGIVISAAIGGAAIISVLQFVIGRSVLPVATPSPQPQVIYEVAPSAPATKK